MTTYQKLALKAIALGADKIPDKFFHSIPGGFFKEQERQEHEREQERERRHHHHRSEKPSKKDERGRRASTGRRYSDEDHDYNSSDDYYTSEEEARRSRRRRRRRQRSSRRPGDNMDNERRSRDLRDASYPPQPYNSAHYATPATGAVAGAASANPYYYGSGVGYPPGPAAYSPPKSPPNVYTPSSQEYGQRRPSSAEMRYTPSGQEGYDGTPRGYALQQPDPYTPPQSGAMPPQDFQNMQPDSCYIPPYNPADYAQPPQPGNTFPSPTQQSIAAATGAAAAAPLLRQHSYSQPSSPERSRRHKTRDRHRSRSQSREHRGRGKSVGRARSKSRFRERLKNMDDNERKIAASLAGALGGGFVGHELGHGTFPTLLGAVLGGASLRALEKKKKKGSGRKNEEQASDQTGVHSDDGRNQSSKRYVEDSESDAEDDRRSKSRRGRVKDRIRSLSRSVSRRRARSRDSRRSEDSR